MRELERGHPATAATDAPATPGRLVIVGAGRAGGAIASAASAGGLDVEVVGRGGGSADEHSLVLLCVPDAAIADACAAIVPGIESGTPVGHVSGATGLDSLAAATAAGCPVFSLHPLQTIPSPSADLAGAPSAIAASDGQTLARVRALAEALGMRPFEVPETGRAAYHAAASMASNFLVALEESAVRALTAAGVSDPRSVLSPLVLRTAANWADAGAAALTGPIARGDEDTVAAHVDALTERAPELLPLYEALAQRTREIGAEAKQ
ncbi:hypothetical protein BH24ACT23_BH24ACT23_04240 [soil metagenome]